jgi:hypothetical protein
MTNNVTIDPSVKISRNRGITSWVPHLVLFLLPFCAVRVSGAPTPESWVPVRWTGGPLEIVWRTRTKTLPADAAARDAIARWYEPDTLRLLEDSPANCLLVTWSAPVDPAVEAEQQQLVTAYVKAAHKHELIVLGLVYAAGDPSHMAGEAKRAALDGLVLDGDFAPDFPVALRKAAGSMLVVQIAQDAASWRWQPAPLIAVSGMIPRGRNLSEMGIRGAPSSEAWIESNLWLVRSFGILSPSRPVWISSRVENASLIDYARAVADAAAAGGHWIISLEDAFRSELRAGDTSALDAWHHLSSYLRFAENHPSWRTLAPYGFVGIVLNPASATADEYLKLVTRRQVPYRLVARSDLNAATLTQFRVIVATELDPPSKTEHKLLQDFADGGGTVITGSSWGGAPTTEPFAEVRTGKGRVIVYKDPDPESLARDLKELLSDEELGMVPFNVPSVITCASGGGPGQPVLVQLVNYFAEPVAAITLRAAGEFRSARLETPEQGALSLPLRVAEGRTEVTIPKLLLWGAVSLQ